MTQENPLPTNCLTCKVILKKKRKHHLYCDECWKQEQWKRGNYATKIIAVKKK